MICFNLLQTRIETFCLRKSQRSSELLYVLAVNSFNRLEELLPMECALERDATFERKREDMKRCVVSMSESQVSVLVDLKLVCCYKNRNKRKSNDS